MNGMQMMLKSMGIDADLIQSQLTQAKDAIEAKVSSMDASIGAMTAMLQAHGAMIVALCNAMQRIEIKLNTLPAEEAQKLLAENTPSAEELERTFNAGRNDRDDNDGN